MKRLMAIPFVLSCVLGAVDLHAQAPTMTYDTFMKMDVNARQERFLQLTPDNEADILREQVIRRRWLNADRLTNEQHEILAEVAEFIRPDFFGSPLHDDGVKATFMALQQRIGKTFTSEESVSAFTINGPYLPPHP